MTEPFLPDGHRCPEYVEQCGVTVPECLGSAVQAQLLQDVLQ